jgi:hypothetical protein
VNEGRGGRRGSAKDDESAGWWDYADAVVDAVGCRSDLVNTSYREGGYEDVFCHDIAPELAAEARRRERDENSRALRQPWPLPTWPKVRTKYLLCRQDRMFPAEWARCHARERLGIEPDEMDGGHYVTLSRPRMLPDRLAAYAAGTP